MRIEDHETSMLVFDREEADIASYLDSIGDKSSAEYRSAVEALRVLQEVKKGENEMEIAQLKHDLDLVREQAESEFRVKDLELKQQIASNDFAIKQADLELRTHVAMEELELKRQQLELEREKLELETVRVMGEDERAEGEASLRKKIARAEFVKGLMAMGLLVGGTMVIRHGEMTGEAVLSGNAKQEVKGLRDKLLPKI